LFLKQGEYRIAKMLIENAANLEAIGDLGNRPLHVAASGGHTQVCLAFRGAQLWACVLKI